MGISARNKTLLGGLAGIGAVVALNHLLRLKRKISFQHKTVVITGGSRGLGLVLARLFAKEGANIAICARDADELRRAMADLQFYGVPVFTYPCDVTDKNQVHEFFQAVRREIGPIDVLVNNAGIIIGTPLDQATEEDFREAIETNFWGAYFATNEVLPAMRAYRSGRIVNIASFGGKVAFPHLLPYSVSKFTLVGYSEGLRAELLNDGVYVTTVCPGLIRSGSPRNAWFKGQHKKEYAWFKIGDSLPLLSMSAEQTAHEIIDACRYGKAEVITTLPAQLASAFHGLFPGLTADILSIVNRLLPSPEATNLGNQRFLGKDSETPITRSALTKLTDEAAVANNELGQ